MSFSPVVTHEPAVVGWWTTILSASVTSNSIIKPAWNLAGCIKIGDKTGWWTCLEIWFSYKLLAIFAIKPKEKRYQIGIKMRSKYKLELLSYTAILKLNKILKWKVLADIFTQYWFLLDCVSVFSVWCCICPVVCHNCWIRNYWKWTWLGTCVSCYIYIIGSLGLTFNW